MKVLAIAALNLRRLFRDRSNIFWVIISPLLFLLVLGLLFGGGQPLQLGVVGGQEGRLAQRLADGLAAEQRVQVSHVAHADALRTQVERGELNAAVVIPPDYDTGLRAGDRVVVEYLSRPDDVLAADLGVWVRSVVRQEAAVLHAAQFGQRTGGGDFDDYLRTAEQTQLPGVEVTVTTTGDVTYPEGLSQFAPIAPSLLLLFVFLTSLTASLGLIQARQLGVTVRMLATPTPARTIVAGEALGRFGVALTQGLVVMLGSALLFGVRWGDPLGAAAVLLLFCLIGSGAAMVIGTLFRSEGAAIGASLGLGLGLAGIGGVMLPLEVMSESMQRVARFTPHAWGYEAFAELVRHGGTVTDVLPQLGVLAGMAVVLLGLGIWRLTRAVTA